MILQLIWNTQDGPPEVELTTCADRPLDLLTLLHLCKLSVCALVLSDTVEVCLGSKRSLDYGFRCDSDTFEGNGVVAFS